MCVEIDNWDNSPYMAHPLIILSMLATSFQCVVSCIEVFSVLGNDFGGLWSQLRSGLYSGYVLYITFLWGE